MGAMSQQQYHFTVIVEPCEEGGYFAECPAFQGCHVQGETYEETLHEMKEAIHAFIGDYRKNKEAIPEDEVTVTSLRVAG